MNRDRQGFVLVSVLAITLATWALLAAMLVSAFLHYRMALGAERGAVAGAAAQRAVDALVGSALAHRAATGAWPNGVEVDDLGTCDLEIAEVVDDGAWWRIAVRAGFEGSISVREATVHAP